MNKEGSTGLIKPWARPTPARFPNILLYTLMDNTPVHCKPSVWWLWSFGSRCRFKFKLERADEVLNMSYSCPRFSSPNTTNFYRFSKLQTMSFTKQNSLLENPLICPLEKFCREQHLFFWKAVIVHSCKTQFTVGSPATLRFWQIAHFLKGKTWASRITKNSPSPHNAKQKLLLSYSLANHKTDCF